MKLVLGFLVLFSFGNVAIASKSDSVANGEIEQLKTRIIEIEKKNFSLQSNVDSVDELNKVRFSDLYTWIVIFAALLAGVSVLVTINANSVAKKQAIEELEKLSNIIESLESKTIKIEAQLEEAETKLQVFESLKKKENE